MRGKGMLIIILALGISHLMVSRADAIIFIHEFLADPAFGLAGDANKDGVRDSSEDEFIELYNSSAQAVDLGGWSISDGGATEMTRHIFKDGTQIKAYSTFVIFGGGNPVLSGIDWQTASSGGLSLNNSGDIFTLYDDMGIIVDRIVYGGEASDDQSLTRNPQGSQGRWIKHTEHNNSGDALFSPGYLLAESSSSSPATVPEPGTLVSLMLGVGTLFIVRKK